MGEKRSVVMFRLLLLVGAIIGFFAHQCSRAGFLAHFLKCCFLVEWRYWLTDFHINFLQLELRLSRNY